MNNLKKIEKIINGFKQQIKASMLIVLKTNRRAKVLMDLYRNHTAWLEIQIKKSGAYDSLACKEGCSYCCYQPVVSMAIEVLSIVSYIKSLPVGKQEKFSSYLQTAIRAAGGFKTHPDRIRSRIPCAFLLEGECLIYEHRPLACRAYVSNKLEPCLRFFKNPSIESDRESNLQIFAGNWAIENGTAAACKEAGFDAEGLHFEKAVLYFLQNADAEEHWLKKRKLPDEIKMGVAEAGILELKVIQ